MTTELGYFTTAEFACKCGRAECDAPKTVNGDLLARLNQLRQRVGHPLRVTSGLRCAVWNTQVGGVGDSEHMTGEAADIVVANGAERFALLAANWDGTVPLFNRVGVGATFIHFGVSASLPTNVVWTYPAKTPSA